MDRENNNWIDNKAPANRAIEIPSEVFSQILAKLERLSKEVSRLTDAVRRPERIRYRPDALAVRLGYKSSRSVRELWNTGKLVYNRDGRGRYSTEAQVHIYERDYCTRK